MWVTLFCTAQPRINICKNFKHCRRVITYLNCAMSKTHVVLQSQCLRNKLIKAASRVVTNCTLSTKTFKKSRHVKKITKNHAFSKPFVWEKGQKIWADVNTPPPIQQWPFKIGFSLRDIFPYISSERNSWFFNCYDHCPGKVLFVFTQSMSELL